MIELTPRRPGKWRRLPQEDCTPPVAALPVPGRTRPPGWKDYPALDAGDDDLCHPDGLTPRYLRARAQLVARLEQAEARRADRLFSAPWPPITPEEWRAEWQAALFGRATNQGWAVPYTGAAGWLYDTRARGAPRLRVLYRESATQASCLAFEDGGAVQIINPNLRGGGEIIEADNPDRAERLASYAWPEPPFRV